MHTLPKELDGRVFSRAEAAALGITPRVLRGDRIASVWPGHYRYASTPLTDRAMVEACAAVAPPDAVLSHTSALWLRGLTMRPVRPVHFVTNTGKHLRRPHVVVHRFEGVVEPETIDGLPTLSPARTFVDCGTILDLAELVAVGDWMVGRGLVKQSTLVAFAEQCHFDGVQKARVAADLVRTGAESIPESITRAHLVVFGLPEPQVNVNISTEAGVFLGRGDLS